MNNKTSLLALFTYLLVPGLLLGVLPGALAGGPLLLPGTTTQVAEQVYVIPDGRVGLVPNVGIIIGTEAVMVVDTGMGPTNAEIVLAEVRKLSQLPIRFLAITHFHPEHGMGAQSFPASTQIIVPLAQRQELHDKGQAFIEMFTGFGPEIAALLADISIMPPDLSFERALQVDLGDLEVQLLHFGPAHTRGDMFVYLPAQGILFGGDVVVERFFPIMPDEDSSGVGWINTLDALLALQPKIVVPGHGAVGDAQLITEMRTYLLELNSRVAALKLRGIPLPELDKMLTTEFQARYQHWDDPSWISKAVATFYSEL